MTKVMRTLFLRLTFYSTYNSSAEGGEKRKKKREKE